MPGGMNGYELAAVLRSVQPDLAVVYMLGSQRRRGQLARVPSATRRSSLTKPVTASELAAAIDSVLPARGGRVTERPPAADRRRRGTVPACAQPARWNAAGIGASLADGIAAPPPRSSSARRSRSSCATSTCPGLRAGAARADRRSVAGRRGGDGHRARRHRGRRARDRARCVRLHREAVRPPPRSSSTS